MSVVFSVLLAAFSPATRQYALVVPTFPPRAKDFVGRSRRPTDHDAHHCGSRLKTPLSVHDTQKRRVFSVGPNLDRPCAAARVPTAARRRCSILRHSVKSVLRSFPGAAVQIERVLLAGFLRLHLHRARRHQPVNRELMRHDARAGPHVFQLGDKLLVLLGPIPPSKYRQPSA